MQHDIKFGFADATAEQRHEIAEQLVDHTLARIRLPLIQCVLVFFETSLSPTSLMIFELAVWQSVRELGRLLLEAVLNACEPDDGERLPKDIWCQGGYRRGHKKTRCRIASRFGEFVLWRRGYRSWDPGGGSIFPLQMLLGLNHSATPALLDYLGRAMAAAGANQDAVLKLLREDCGVRMGVKRLRQCVARLAEAMEEHRQPQQVEVLLEALQMALKSKGSRRPVLSVGRDGITLRQYDSRKFEVATTATISVYDRRGNRLVTVYLAWPPEPGQATMDQMLTALIQDLLNRYEGPLPRLAYVTDSGCHETGYYEVLQQMLHPRSLEPLEWIRVADFYHASERIWTMAEQLFSTDTTARKAWAKRMLSLLKKPGGARRVLQSAASHFHRQARQGVKHKKKQKSEFWQAYRYIRNRTQFMCYSEFKSLHIPLGSGVTEAACKTVFTQRLKNSGMRWSFEGAKTILCLRTILLSTCWDKTYAACLKAEYPDTMRPYHKHRIALDKIAA